MTPSTDLQLYNSWRTSAGIRSFLYLKRKNEWVKWNISVRKCINALHPIPRKICPLFLPLYPLSLQAMQKNFDFIISTEIPSFILLVEIYYHGFHFIIYDKAVSFVLAPWKTVWFPDRKSPPLFHLISWIAAILIWYFPNYSVKFLNASGFP